MATISLPVRNDLPHFTFNCELEGQTYGFEFWWNDRLPGWFMSISTVDGTLVLSGVRLSEGFPLTARFKDSRLPPGAIMAIDTTGRQADPRLEDLGARTQLAYIESADL